ncbi:MAG: hypothetical protein HFH41_00875 [Lachnospiraceae bacterium]|nr:hypothetical protein [Lachnospiraceae bacterium]
MNYTHDINSTLINGSYYGKGCFASPMKELNEQTVLVENNRENKNDSYRQKTKYDDRVDHYYSTYDLGILLQNSDSYLEGKLDTNEDADCYSFSYFQKNFYEKMGLETEVTIRLENIPEGCNYDLIVYDMQGNQVGIGKDNGHGGRELTLPDWNESGRYTIKVENRGDGNVNTEAPYRIRITEERYQKQEKTDERQEYTDEIERLHREQYDSLPEDERYTGAKNVEELLEKKASGERMDSQEEAYLKIFANLHDYERASAQGRIRNMLFPKIEEALRNAGIHVQGKEFTIEMDIYGEIIITGDLSEEEKQKAAGILEEQFADELWDCHMQASNDTTEEFNRINAYKELSSFLRKSTGGQYSWKDISVDENGKIRGLPQKMCQLLNSQESNGRYEQLRDDILMLYDYGRVYGMDELSDYKVRYEVAGSDVKSFKNAVNSMNEPLIVNWNAVVDPYGIFKSFAMVESRLKQLTDPTASKKDEDMEKIAEEYARGKLDILIEKKKAMQNSGMAKSSSEEYAEYKAAYNAYHSENGENLIAAMTGDAKKAYYIYKNIIDGISVPIKDAEFLMLYNGMMYSAARSEYVRKTDELYHIMQ